MILDVRIWRMFVQHLSVFVSTSLEITPEVPLFVGKAGHSMLASALGASKQAIQCWLLTTCGRRTRRGHHDHHHYLNSLFVCLWVAHVEVKFQVTLHWENVLQRPKSPSGSKDIFFVSASAIVQDGIRFTANSMNERVIFEFCWGIPMKWVLHPCTSAANGGAKEAQSCWERSNTTRVWVSLWFLFFIFDSKETKHT